VAGGWWCAQPRQHQPAAPAGAVSVAEAAAAEMLQPELEREPERDPQLQHHEPEREPPQSEPPAHDDGAHSAAALTLQRARRRAVRRRPANSTDPITLEDVATASSASRSGQPLFRYVDAAGVLTVLSAQALADYGLTAGELIHPLSRARLDACEVLRLEHALVGAGLAQYAGLAAQLSKSVRSQLDQPSRSQNRGRPRPGLTRVIVCAGGAAETVSRDSSCGPQLPRSLLLHGRCDPPSGAGCRSPAPSLYAGHKRGIHVAIRAASLRLDRHASADYPSAADSGEQQCDHEHTNHVVVRRPDLILLLGVRCSGPCCRRR
jgi:hypothetical protein